MAKLGNPPHDSLSDNFTTCSAWCYSKWEEALERGDEKAANNYMQMYNLWKERNQ